MRGQVEVKAVSGLNVLVKRRPGAGVVSLFMLPMGRPFFWAILFYPSRFNWIYFGFGWMETERSIN